MPKLITFKAPALDKGKIVHIEKSGYVVKLYVGNIQEKFVIQTSDLFPEEGEFLTHYASGNKVGALNPIKIRNMTGWGTAHRTTDREAAKQLLEEIVAKVGADKVLKVMRAAPVLNA
ncbi:hypothetical protein [Rhizobium phaseoli]|uniref:hypothetical protein n=1 Tax=Rhizobium phaseoli TaxID=396 RepID=UPI0025522081|nr:hypothetical protein [Rhizobium phaseoli]MDK4729357.1 hypothetical protein [Rhizobium phaseoli]